MEGFGRWRAERQSLPSSSNSSMASGRTLFASQHNSPESMHLPCAPLSTSQCEPPSQLIQESLAILRSLNLTPRETSRYLSRLPHSFLNLLARRKDTSSDQKNQYDANRVTFSNCWEYNEKEIRVAPANDPTENLAQLALHSIKLNDQPRGIQESVISVKKPRRHRKDRGKSLAGTRRTRSGSDADDERPPPPQPHDTAVSRTLNRASVIWNDEDYVCSGTFGDIYKGDFHGRAVCVKLIRPLQIEGDDVRKLTAAFARESAAWARLCHPNIVQIYGCCLDVIRPCLVSPWVENSDVNAYLLRNPNANRYSLISDVLNGLQYLHSAEIIHGNLKGSNVLINSYGHAQLTDYQTSSIIYSTIEDWGVTATVPMSIGTRRWEAPELFDCENAKTVQSDVYGWACVCYEIFTGQCPFYEFRTDEAVVFQILMHSATPSRPSSDAHAWTICGLIEEVWDFLSRCWSHVPSSRPTLADIPHYLAGFGLIEGDLHYTSQAHLAMWSGNERFGGQ